MTAEARDSLTKPHRLWKAFQEKPDHACPQVPLNIYSNCATTMNHHDEFSTTAAPTSPHSNFNISNQLKNVCRTKAIAAIHAITIILLCDCKSSNFLTWRIVEKSPKFQQILNLGIINKCTLLTYLSWYLYPPTVSVSVLK